MAQQKKIAVLVSGGGTNLQALIDAEKRGEVEATNEELPKSFVLYFDENDDPRICFSQISSSALGGRAGDSEKYDETGV